MKGKGRKVPARLGREPAEQPLLPGTALSPLRASALAPRPGWGRPGVRPRGDSRQRETGIGVGASGRTRAMSPGLPGRLGGDQLSPGPAAASAAGTGRRCVAPAGKVPLLCNGEEVLSLPGAGCKELAAGSGPGRLPKASCPARGRRVRAPLLGVLRSTLPRLARHIPGACSPVPGRSVPRQAAVPLQEAGAGARRCARPSWRPPSPPPCPAFPALAAGSAESHGEGGCADGQGHFLFLRLAVSSGE